MRKKAVSLGSSQGVRGVVDKDWDLITLTSPRDVRHPPRAIIYMSSIATDRDGGTAFKCSRTSALLAAILSVIVHALLHSTCCVH